MSIDLFPAAQESSDAAPGVTFMLKGASAHQKIVLVRQKPTTAAREGQGKAPPPSHVPSLSLQFAHHCLQNAAFNLDTASTGKRDPLNRMGAIYLAGKIDM